MTILPKENYRFNAIYQITNDIFHRTETKNIFIVWRHKRPQIAGVILRKKNAAFSSYNISLSLILQLCVGIWSYQMVSSQWLLTVPHISPSALPPIIYWVVQKVHLVFLWMLQNNLNVWPTQYISVSFTSKQLTCMFPLFSLNILMVIYWLEYYRNNFLTLFLDRSCILPIHSPYSYQERSFKNINIR